MSEQKQKFWVHLVKNIHVAVEAENEHEAEVLARENNEGFAYDGYWQHAPVITYDVIAADLFV
jgi:hypothetical protein